MNVKWYFKKGPEVFKHSIREQYCCAATAGSPLVAWRWAGERRIQSPLNTLNISTINIILLRDYPENYGKWKMPRREAQFPPLKPHISNYVFKIGSSCPHKSSSSVRWIWDTGEVGGFQFSSLYLRVCISVDFEAIEKARYFLYKQVWFNHSLPKFKCEELNASLD